MGDFNFAFKVFSIIQFAFQTAEKGKLNWLQEALLSPGSSENLGRWSLGGVRVQGGWGSRPSTRPQRSKRLPNPQTETPEGFPLLEALPRRGHEEGLSSGRRATGNPEVVSSAALFKDGGGGTSAAEAGAAG